MKLPFITREAHERAMNAAQTEIWDLRRTVRTLREREQARMACCAVIEQEAGELRELFHRSIGK